jgi:putative DNA primase/helicase
MNRKFKTPIAFQFKGFMVQCLNEMPKIKDKSDSFYRRQLFIPFTKCFTGRERKYIKQDYLHRKDVLEYVLYKVLNMNYYQLSVPEACKAALEDYKEYNDPVRQFVDEILPECRWDLLPFTFLYDLYKAWYERNIGKTGLQGRNTFIDNLLNVIKDSTEWSCLDKKARITSKGLMDAPEPLILEYNLEHWQNSRYIGSKDRDKAATPDNLKKEYRGLQRLVDVD